MEKTQLIEKTGKGIKGQQVLATLGLFAGAITCVGSVPWGVTIGAICLVWLIALKIAKWWRHG